MEFRMLRARILCFRHHKTTSFVNPFENNDFVRYRDLANTSFQRPGLKTYLSLTMLSSYRTVLLKCCLEPSHDVTSAAMLLFKTIKRRPCCVSKPDRFASYFIYLFKRFLLSSQISIARLPTWVKTLFSFLLDYSSTLSGVIFILRVSWYLMHWTQLA